MLGWSSHWRRWRDQRTLQRRPIPDALWQLTLARFPFLDRPGAAERLRLRELATLFLASKEFSGANGLAVSDEMAVAIAAQACLPVLHLGLDWYDGFVGIVVHPDAVVARREVTDDDGVVHQYDEVISGEAMAGGPVVFSWEDVTLAGSHEAPAYNVVIHEFAHKIDMLKGEATGVPPFVAPFHQGVDGRAFERVMGQAYSAFVAQVERWEAGGCAEQDMPLLDPYAAEHPAEFFAVLSEAFFTCPLDVVNAFPELYRLLAAYYLQDPLRGAAV